MTILTHSQLRGFFEPVTLGLHAPADLEEIRKYVDDVSGQDAATFVHELSHYLQFYGTTFGYAYLLSIRGGFACLQDGMKSMLNQEGLRFPASSWPIDITKVFRTSQEKEFYTQAILMNRYYNEELYGFTYAHFGQNHPIHIDKQMVLTSPLFLELDDGTPFPFTGETLLENYAVCQELQFLSTYAPREMTKNCLENTYLSLPKELEARYMGIGVWFATFGLLHIEPLLYFVLLNQRQEGFLRRLGDYTLAFNTKKLLTEFSSLKELPRPKTNDETRDVLREIATISGMADPLDVISKWRRLLKPSVESRSWVVDWVSGRIWDWYLEEPLRILMWPENLQSLLKGIPLLNLHFANREEGESRNFLNVPRDELTQRHIALIIAHHNYCERLYVINGLYNHTGIRCPYFWKSRPKLCTSCQECPGQLPNDKISDDCPVMKEHGDLINLVAKR